jgi:hypothetical protein
MVFASVLQQSASSLIEMVIQLPNDHQTTEKPRTPHYFLNQLQQPQSTFVIFLKNMKFHVCFSDADAPVLERLRCCIEDGERQLQPSFNLVAASRCRSH